jgi:hypothetical protein
MFISLIGVVVSVPTYFVPEYIENTSRYLGLRCKDDQALVNARCINADVLHTMYQGLSWYIVCKSLTYVS